MEELMQYVWRFRLWPQRHMVTVDGNKIDVLDPGILNKDSGPDFFNAKIQINGQIWVGDIELHVRASDWHRHGHDGDKAYESVILHVVDRSDDVIYRANGEAIPQMVMNCALDFSQKYHQLVNNPVLELPCSYQVKELSALHISDWMSALAHERLFAKADRIKRIVEGNNGNWTEAIYITLGRALGFSTNSEPFELLASTTPLKCLMRHSDDIDTIDAILFGQSGLLDHIDAADNNYASMLHQEYNFYATKYDLHRSQNIMWKMARMRPGNFPHRRIATLGQMVYGGFNIATNMLSVQTEEQARELFNINLRGYWARHFNFTDTTVPTVRAFGYDSVTVLLINVVVPINYAYGEATGDDKRMEFAKDLLCSLKPEKNSIVDIFGRAGIVAQSAFETQAMIQLRREYCQQRKCLYCRWGHRLLSDQVVRG